MYPEDKAIVSLFFDRNELALSYTEKKYGDLCRRVADNILHNKEDVSECVDSSYFSLWNSIPPARPDSLKAYLCAIVRNTAFAMFKRRSRRDDVPFASELAEISDGRDIENIIDSRLLGGFINEFLSQQRDSRRKIFVLRFYFNYSLKDISDMLKMNESTVKSHLQRLKKELKSFLSGKGYDI